MKTLALVFFLILAFTAPARAADQPPPDEVTIAAVGDLMLGGRTQPFLQEFGPDYPFAEVSLFSKKQMW